MVQVGTLIQSDAKIVRVVSLRAGDVYKRLTLDSYGKGKLSFGVVTDVLQNGSQAAVCAVEYDTSYNTVDAKTVTLSDQEDVSIYPALPMEIESYFLELEEVVARQIETRTRELRDAQRKSEQIRKILDGELRQAEVEPVVSGELTG